MSSDDLHPADFLASLAYAIKAVRDRGGKWNKTADTIQWASDRITQLETKLHTLEQNYDLCKAELAGVISDAKAQALRLDKALELARMVSETYGSFEKWRPSVMKVTADAILASGVETQRTNATAHVHNFKPSGLVPGEMVCACGNYYVV